MDTTNQPEQNQKTNDQTETLNTQFPSIFSLHKESFEALKIAFIPLLKLAIRPILALLPLVLIVMLQTLNSSSGEPSILINVISILAGIVSIVAFIIFALRVAPASAFVQINAVRGKKVEPKEALEATKNMVANFFLVSLLSGLIIVVGFILLIIPGLFMLKRYALVGYHLVDHNLGVGAAMERSEQFSKKYSDAHWGIVALQVVINIVNYVPFVGGIIALVMTVVYYMVGALRYNQVNQAG